MFILWSVFLLCNRPYISINLYYICDGSIFSNIYIRVNLNFSFAMKYDKQIAELVKPYADIVRVFDYVIVRGLAYISCTLKTTGTYYLVDEDGHTFYKSYDRYDGYISPYNRGIIGKTDKATSFYTDCAPEEADLFELGVGDSLVIIDTETGGITVSYYFKDTYNMPSPVKIIKGFSDDFLILVYSEISYYLKTDDHSLRFFEGTNVAVYENYIIRLPYYGYDMGFSDCSIVNTLTWKELSFGDDVKRVVSDDDYWELSVDPTLITRLSMHSGVIVLTLLLKDRDNRNHEFRVTDDSMVGSEYNPNDREESYAKVQNAYREVKRISVIVEEHRKASQ